MYSFSTHLQEQQYSISKIYILPVNSQIWGFKYDKEMDWEGG